MSPTHVVLLAGGTGSRMPPLVSADHPKCLLTIANRPMIFYSLFSLTLSFFPTVTVIVTASFLDPIRKYCEEVFPSDPLVVALSSPPPALSFVTRNDDAGTADVLRDLDIPADDTLVLSSDYIGDVDLAAVVAHHRATHAGATVAFLPAEKKPDAGKQAKGKKPAKKKPSKTDASKFSVESYALLSGGDDRLLGLFSTADISGGSLTLRAPLVQRYSSIRLRSDLVDPHIYVFNTTIVQRLLSIYRNISSVKYELVPYLARRQHTLTRDAAAYDWTVPMDEIAVFATVLKSGTFAKRANTVGGFQAANVDAAAGRLEAYLKQAKEADTNVGNAGPTGKKKGKKSSPKVSPFASEGERVSVTPDSLVGPRVTAGDRASVKKSVIGADCTLAANVKVNSCVILSNVTLEEGVNLAGCIICEDAVIGKNSLLNDCRVSRSVTVEAETEGQERDFTQLHPVDDASFDMGFEFC